MDSKASFINNYEICPIILLNGLASQLNGAEMPIIQLTEANTFNQYSDAQNIDYNSFFARFQVLSGGALENWGVAEYPFANMITAANAVVQNPLTVSLLMRSPAKNDGDYTNKLAQFTGLKSAIDNHIQLGGSFRVLTPAYTYDNCLLTSLRDVTSSNDGKQVQQTWQWDFYQPLITQQGAVQAYTNAMNKYSQGLPTPNPPTWSQGSGYPLTANGENIGT